MDVPREIKLCLLGGSQVGKTCLFSRLGKDKFIANPLPTIGADFCIKHTTTPINGAQLKYIFWDTAGQERYENLAPVFYQGSDVIAAVYDITDTKSFNKAKYWIQTAKDKTHDSSSKDVIYVIVGNKLDLAEEQRHVSQAKAEKYASSMGALFYEVSCKTSENVEKMFIGITKKILDPNDTDNISVQNDSCTIQ